MRSIRASSLAAVALAAWLLAFPVAVAGDEGGWTHGRVTFYGNDGGATVDQGSCQFGALQAGQGTGLDIGALSDSDPEFGGSCGRCYEVACVNDDITDGYGERLSRKGSCKGDATVTITITDTCPCNYPSNYYSNKRWCCGDTRHIDMSYHAFDKIASQSAGVVAARWRRVPCPSGSPSKPTCSNWASCFNTGDGSGGSSSSGGSNSNNGNGGNNDHSSNNDHSRNKSSESDSSNNNSGGDSRSTNNNSDNKSSSSSSSSSGGGGGGNKDNKDNSGGSGSSGNNNSGNGGGSSSGGKSDQKGPSASWGRRRLLTHDRRVAVRHRAAMR